MTILKYKRRLLPSKCHLVRGAVNCHSYILSWGKATGAGMGRFGSLKKEIDRKVLAHAVETMKATLNDCNLGEVKREARQELSNKLVPTSAMPNLLKRPCTPLLEGVLTNKRTQLANLKRTE
jgi:hypothetical protein